MVKWKFEDDLPRHAQRRGTLLPYFTPTVDPSGWRRRRSQWPIYSSGHFWRV